MLLLHRRQRSHQQRVRQAEVCLRRAVAADPRPLHEARGGCLTGDFSKGAEREAHSGDSGDRRIIPLEAARLQLCLRTLARFSG